MTDHFVADGEERLCRALELKFRSEVEPTDGKRVRSPVRATPWGRNAVA